MDEAQPQEQAVFRQGFRCLDHIQTVSRVIDFCWEYLLPIVLTFFDYEKAFDSVETKVTLSALIDQGVDASHVRTLANCYDRSRKYSISTALSPYPSEEGYDKAIVYRRSCSLLHYNG
ncbi:hypothetical protein RB195_004341 [Necator americanus]|uniref:Reverse transcriptase domain-containing protein n=1 Tax=Necator americanus TaxID=51031 RepID=A0ABR1BHI1_NECAM